MKRQLKRQIRQFIRKILPFCLGLLLVGVQIGPSVAQAPIRVAVDQPRPNSDPETVVASPEVPAAGTPADDAEPSTTAPTFTVPEVPQPPDESAKTEAMPDVTASKSPEELLKFNQFVEADRLYQAGKTVEAAKIYRQLKPNFDGSAAAEPLPSAVQDIAQMSRAANVYWRESTAGLKLQLEGRTFVPLKLLVKEYPQFIPGHLRLAKAYEDYGKAPEALAVLQAASARYPNEVELLDRRITALAQAEQWMEGSIAARQFALLNPEHPQAERFEQLANENLRLYRKNLKRQLTGNVIGNVITGALGYAVTGSLIGPLNSLQTSFLLLRGESALGESVARRAKDALELVTDEATNQYVNEIGKKLAAVAGREDFKYEFVVVKDKALNAFALPGGKVFINAGAIAKTSSEAELAGLVGHEISHAVLAHGLQLFTQGSLTSNITQFIPYVGGLAENIITFSYSRDMERQADVVGTRLLASAGYASDGLWKLMQSLQREEAAQKRSRPPEWLSTHPGGDERLKNVEQLITQVGYDRYAYEGVERHAVIQQKMEKLLKADAAQKCKIVDKRQGQEDCKDRPTPNAQDQDAPANDTPVNDTPPTPGTTPDPADPSTPRPSPSQDEVLVPAVPADVAPSTSTIDDKSSDNRTNSAKAELIDPKRDWRSPTTTITTPLIDNTAKETP
ncbi:M48 family metalloprotease [filamentous cyanobacterium LEGE 11480]|uniref:M48 family metalloprotease n=1 Tax=Romeriopsis navalis LEGE 11480 TaxID=2777977 RepID=A0A928VQ41_9CYAN|nr:M48 family metallopeptidase [Romeriopsis navalis]MBE9032698.1 M48 family metalloprotease [Romeriopsis navalis LEGE 11480]